MPKIQVLARQIGGIYHRRKFGLNRDWPAFLMDRHGAYSLAEDPIFPKGNPVKLDTWEALASYQPGPPVRKLNEKWLMLSEENNPWPLSCNPQNMGERQRHWERFMQEAYEVAEAKASQESLGNTLLTFGFMAAVVIACLMALGILLVFGQARFGGDKDQAAPGVPAPRRTVPAASYYLVDQRAA